MPKALSAEERFRRAESAVAEAKRLADSITRDTPGSERAALIAKVRTQYNAAHTAVAQFTNARQPDTAEKRRAVKLLEEAEKQVQRARKFS